jgi:uncharacterized linocin/CFP29 family protein
MRKESVVKMAGLTQEQYEFVVAEVKKAARRVTIGRQLIPTPPPLGFGAETIKYDKLTEMAEGRTDLEWGHGFSEDTVFLTPDRVPVPVMHKEFELNRRHVEASQRNGTPLPTTAIDAASYAVMKQEDIRIIKGYSKDGTNYEVPGLFTGAGNSDTGADFGTATNIPVTMQEGIAKLVEDNIPGPYTLVCHPTQYNELFALIGGASAVTDSMYYDYVIKRLSAIAPNGEGLLESQPGRVLCSAVLTTAYCMILGPPTLKFAEYQVGADLTVETKELEKGGNTWGVVYVTGAPLLYDSNGICTLGC